MLLTCGNIQGHLGFVPVLLFLQTVSCYKDCRWSASNPFKHDVNWCNSGLELFSKLSRCSCNFSGPSPVWSVTFQVHWRAPQFFFYILSNRHIFQEILLANDKGITVLNRIFALMLMICMCSSAGKYTPVVVNTLRMHLLWYLKYFCNHLEVSWKLPVQKSFPSVFRSLLSSSS